jgi:hypothetical protein
MAKIEIVEKEYSAEWDDRKIPETNYKKIFVPEDSYNGLKKTVEVINVPDFNDHSKKIEKIAIVIGFDYEGEEMELTHFLQPKISKGSTGKNGKIYSNSKLYDLLIDTGLRDTFKSELGAKFTANQVAQFLNKHLEKEIRFTVKTSKANTPEQYSTCAKILRFV